jgi:hypothetical protein
MSSPTPETEQDPAEQEPLIVRKRGKKRLHTETARKSIEESVSGSVGRAVVVRCRRFVPVGRGKTFVCRVRAKGVKTAKIRVTQTDNAGGTEWELVGQGRYEPPIWPR